MRSFEELRREFDRVDDELIAVLNRRFALSKEMRELKIREGRPSKDKQREEEIISRALAKSDPAERDTVFGIYEKIFGGSRGVVETVARGVAIVDGKVLLCKSIGEAPTYLPGGHIEFGETGREALVREVMEEAGVKAQAGEFLGVVENSFLQKGKRHCEINLVYAMTLEDATAVKSRESWIEFVWISVDELEAARLLPESIRPLVHA